MNPIDLDQLARTVTTFLAPFLPYLLTVAGKATEEASKKFGADAWEQAKALWSKLRPKADAKAGAQEAIREASHAPNDPDTLEMLRLQVKKLLAADTALAQELSDLVQGPAVQRIIVYHHSTIRDAEQISEGGANRQEIASIDNSVIEGVRQEHRERKPNN